MREQGFEWKEQNKKVIGCHDEQIHRNRGKNSVVCQVTAVSSKDANNLQPKMQQIISS